MQLKYFKLSEFDSPDQKGSGSNMNQDFLQKLDRAREIAGIPFKINSGFRTQAHNTKTKGKTNSAHLKGLAADIDCNDSVSRAKIVKALVSVGMRRLGIYEGFIHCDNDSSLPETIWL